MVVSWCWPHLHRVLAMAFTEGHVYTKGIRPWLLSDHSTMLFGQEHRKVHGP